MSKVSGFVKGIGNCATFLDSIIFCRFNPKHDPPKHLALIPAIFGIVLIIVAVILSFCVEESVVVDRLLSIALLWMLGFNVLIHLPWVFKMPTVKLKISYFIFVAAVSYFALWVASVVTYLVIVFVIIFLLSGVLGENMKPSTSAPSGGPQEIKLDNGDVVTHSYGNQYSTYGGKKYTRDGDDFFKNE